MAIHIEYETELSLDIEVEKIVTEVIDTALDMYECPYEAEVNVILTDNPSIAAINEEYRNLAKPTDVLSFPMIDYEIPGDFAIIEELPEEECFVSGASCAAAVPNGQLSASRTSSCITAPYGHRARSQPG